MHNSEVADNIPSLDRFLQLCQRRTYKAKSLILKQGELSESLYLILEGSVSVMVQDESDPDHMMVVSYLNQGDFVGEMGLFESTPQVRSAMVVAKTSCSMAEISHERFNRLRSQFPEVIYAITRQLSRRLRQANSRLSDLAFVDVSGRIAHTLMDLCQEPDAMTHPDGMQIRVTRQELSKIVGCSREMAGRALKSLEQGGLVEVSGKTMVVHGAR